MLLVDVIIHKKIAGEDDNILAERRSEVVYGSFQAKDIDKLSRK